MKKYTRTRTPFVDNVSLARIGRHFFVRATLADTCEVDAAFFKFAGPLLVPILVVRLLFQKLHAAVEFGCATSP